jgi:hypothetical protein
MAKVSITGGRLKVQGTGHKANIIKEKLSSPYALYVVYAMAHDMFH